ncbi:unnamed protein product, partial [Ectocarpus sp. 12 AP-2014]
PRYFISHTQSYVEIFRPTSQERKKRAPTIYLLSAQRRVTLARRITGNHTTPITHSRPLRNVLDELQRCSCGRRCSAYGPLVLLRSECEATTAPNQALTTVTL